MKFGQLLEHLKNTFYLQNNGKNGAERLVPDLFFFKKKKRSFTRGESKWLAASFQYISIAFNLAYRINKLYKTLRLLIQRYAQFWFFRKGPGTIFSTYFFFWDFSRKIFFRLYSINWPHFIAWLPLLFKILDHMCITIVCFPGCDVCFLGYNFEVNLIFLIKPFFYMTKNSWQTFNGPEDEKAFVVK